MQSAPGGVVASPDVTGAWFAWIEYATQDIGTPMDPPILGEVVLEHRMTGARASAPMGIGCLFCGAIWPPPRVRVSSEIVVWNYGQPEGEYPRYGRVHAARLSSCRP